VRGRGGEQLLTRLARQTGVNKFEDRISERHVPLPCAT
jgi:hypothetical protein